MTGRVTRTLLEQQVALTRAVLELRRGMDHHLLSCVKPLLGDNAQRVIQDLLEALDEEDTIDLNLAYFLDGVIGAMRLAIAAGTREDRVAIPRERLFGCDEAFETRTVLSPTAEALKAALPPLQALYTAAKQALDFAEAIRLSIRLLKLD